MHIRPTVSDSWHSGYVALPVLSVLQTILSSLGIAPQHGPIRLNWSRFSFLSVFRAANALQRRGLEGLELHAPDSVPHPAAESCPLVIGCCCWVAFHT